MDQPFEALELYDDVIVQALEGDTGHRAHQVALVHGNDVNILGTNDHVHRLVLLEALVHADKGPAKEPHPEIFQHDTVENVAFSDEVRHESVFGLVINIFGFADLLDAALVHDHNGIGHGKRFLLIVGHINKGNAHGLLNALEFVLHILAQSQVQCTQRLIQEQDLGAIYQSTGNGHTLLLAAGEGVYSPVFITLETDDFQHFPHPLVDLRFGNLVDFKTKGHVVINIQVWEQRISLKNRVDLPLVRRDIIDRLSVKCHRAGCGR